MSLAIDLDRVTAVLLDDGWHTVMWQKGHSSFNIDAYEFLYNGSNTIYQAQDMILGFSFHEGTHDGAPSRAGRICGPLNAIRAVRVTDT